jgi:hypothetical protein
MVQTMSKGILTKAFALMFAVGLLAVVPAAVLADGNGNGNGSGQGSDDRQGNQWKDQSGYLNGRPEDIGQERVQKMLAQSAGHGFFGGFNLTDGVADGRFITFTLDTTSGEVADYALRNGTGVVTVFDSIQIPGLEVQDLDVHGSVMLVSNDTLQVILHDNPTGMFHVVANSTNVSVCFLLSSAMAATLLPPADDGNDNRTVVSIYGQGILGLIATDQGEVTLEQTAQGTYVNVTVSQDHVMFRARPVFSHHHMHGSALLEAISGGRVAGEMSLMVMDGVASYDTMEYQKGFTMQLMSAEKNRLRFMVQSEEHAGKVVVINVDQGTIDPVNRELQVRIDGAEVRMTSNPLEVLYAEGSGSSDAACCIVSSEGTQQVLLYVPSFSTHEVTLTSVGPLDALFTTGGLLAMAGAAALVVVAAIVLTRRRG